MRRQRCSMALAWISVVVVSLFAGEKALRGEDMQVQPANLQSDAVCGTSPPSASSPPELAGLQIETSDIGLHERFFLQALHAPEVQRIDHPQVDLIRGYCYRNVLIVVRQDIKTPRPTGWVQLNFAVADVGMVQQQLEQALRDSDLAKVDEAERKKVVRLRYKPDVPRNNCRVDRLEVNGPEGFMIGFDQVKKDSCKRADDQPQKENREFNRPHH